MNVPIIKLEIGRMQQTLSVALTEHAVRMDSIVQEAIEAYCTPVNLNAIIHQTTTEALDAAVKEEVRLFFSKSNAGRLAVREAVIDYLDKHFAV